MNWTFLEIFDLAGTIAFAISGALVGMHKKMDLFGVNVLAVTTACGGGIMRDLIIGSIPPRTFLDPFYVGVAVLVANIVFWLTYMHRHMPRKMAHLYDLCLFWFDTIGLGTFVVDGVMTGVDAGYGENGFLLVFLGFITGVGGGALRDVLADQMPDIFLKHVYALAAVAGGLSMLLWFRLSGSRRVSMVGGFVTVIVLRYLAARYRWNLPRVS